MQMQSKCCCQEKLDELSQDLRGVKVTLEDLKVMMQMVLESRPQPGHSIRQQESTTKQESTRPLDKLPWYMDPEPSFKDTTICPQPLKPIQNATTHQQSVQDPSPAQCDTTPWYATGSPLPGFFLSAVKTDSCSRSNFTSNLDHRLFSTEERRRSNVKGVLGKSKLNTEKMLQIREATFQMYPCDTMENEGHVWNYCCKAIDESCRRLNRLKENRH